MVILPRLLVGSLLAARIAYHGRRVGAALAFAHETAFIAVCGPEQCFEFNPRIKAPQECVDLGLGHRGGGVQLLKCCSEPLESLA